MKNLATSIPQEINIALHTANYSDIISPQDYNRIVSKEHIYIAASDRFIVQLIQEKTLNKLGSEVVEIGCGPARILTLMHAIKYINLTGIDVDPVFIDYARTSLTGFKINIVETDIRNYKHSGPVTIFYSQGFHHHLEKGEQTRKYLANVYEQLEPGGYYIVSDEFIPHYNNEEERELRLIIWYSHVIDHALKHNHHYLAQEESKTLIDDLQEGRLLKGIKTQEQIQFVLLRVSDINHHAKINLNKAFELAKEFNEELDAQFAYKQQGDPTIDLSRGDYKVCDEVFREEVEDVGFKIEEVKSFGPIDTIGAMSVYVLQKKVALHSAP